MYARLRVADERGAARPRAAAPAAARRHGALPRDGARDPARVLGHRDGVRARLRRRSSPSTSALFTRATAPSACAAILRLAPINGTGAARARGRHRRRHGPVRAAGRSRPSSTTSRRASPACAASSSRADHFVERHGLVVLIAIGESVVAVGIGASARRHRPRRSASSRVAVLGLMLSACLWWAYFGGDDERAVAALRAAPAETRARARARTPSSTAHLLILLGIVAVASTAARRRSATPATSSPTARALALGGGVAVFMAGDVLFRRTLRDRPRRLARARRRARPRDGPDRRRDDRRGAGRRASSRCSRAASAPRPGGPPSR